jgi:hypothetical protein
MDRAMEVRVRRQLVKEKSYERNYRSFKTSKLRCCSATALLPDHKRQPIGLARRDVSYVN